MTICVLRFSIALIACVKLLQASPDWLTNPAALGKASLDGGLSLALPMGPVPCAPEFGLSLQLVHDAAKIKTTEHAQYARRNLMRKQAGVALLPAKPSLKKDEKDPKVDIYRSGWTIPQLVSYLFPANRDRLVWQPPGGGEVEFLRDDMEATPPRFTPEGWFCKELGPAHYRLSDREGWVWEYKNGLPLTLTAPSGRQLEFTHDKGLLVRIQQFLSATEKSTRKDVLKIHYNDQRKPVRLVSELMEHRFTYDKDTGHLVKWESTFFTLASNAAAERKGVNETRPETDPVINADTTAPALAENGNAMGAMYFRYIEDVLAAIRYPGGKIERFRWDVDKGRLLQDGTSTYTHTGAQRSSYTLTRADRAGRRVTVHHDYAKATLTTTYPDGSREVTAYQRRAAGRGLLRERIGRDGQITYRVDYNARHLPVRIRELGKPEIRQVYDERDRLVEIWRAPMVAAIEVENFRSPKTNPKATAASGGETRGDEASGGGTSGGGAPVVSGQLIQRFSYSGAARKPSLITNAADNTIHLEYDDRAQLSRTLGVNGAETVYRYDVWGRLVYRKTPAGFIEQMKYDGHGRIIEQTTEDGRTLTFAYDRAGRLAQRTESGVVFVFRYDNAGRPLEMLRNSQPWGKWAYGSETVTFPAIRVAPGTWQPMPESGFFQSVSYTDSRGGVTKRLFDADGRLAVLVDPLGQWTVYRYNEVGEVVGWVDPRGNALAFERDAMGRIVRQDNAGGQTLRWTYDGAGRLATRANGVQTARYDYDAAGRLASIDYGQGQVVTYERDGYGRLTAAHTTEVDTRYAYDVLDRVVRVEQRPRDGTPSGVAYTYSTTGQKAGITLLIADAEGQLKEGSKTVNRHDLAGRLTTIELDGTVTAEYVYERRTPRLETKILGNGFQYRYSYDTQGRMSELEVQDHDGTLRQRLKYVWDEHGLLDRRVLERPKARVGIPSRVELNYGYDGLGRLTSVISPFDSRHNRRYAYDGAGNLVENRSPDQWLKMEYDAANQLVLKRSLPGQSSDADAVVAAGGDASGTAVPGMFAATERVTQFTYDAAGRMTQEIEGNDPVRSFTYGYLDKVMTVQRPDGRRAAYAYDASGMLVGKRTRTDATSAPETEWWVWDGLALVKRGDEVFVNEPHPAGGMALMSRTPGGVSVADANLADPTPRPAAGAIAISRTKTPTITTAVTKP